MTFMAQADEMSLDHNTYVEAPRKSPPKRIYVIGVAASMAFLGTLGGYVIAKKLNLRDQLAAKAREVAAGPFIETAIAVQGPSERLIKELGETKPYAFATLYAKVSGYLEKITVDKGDTVKKGQLLATIKTPETTSQFASAVADAKNKKAIAARTRKLFKDRVVTSEELDQAVAASDMASAKVEELSTLKGYSEIIAPFDGTITARFADPGALVQDATNAQSGALPIVNISQLGKLRVTIYIDQRVSPFVQVGDPAMITLNERPGVRYEAHVTRKAGDLDTRSRTMLTEIELDNSKGEIVADSFVDVTLRVKTNSFIQIPSQSLIMRGTQAFVALVGSDDTVHYRAIQAGENDGTNVNVISGLKEGERVAVNVGNNLVDGQHVQTDNGSKN